MRKALTRTIRVIVAAILIIIVIAAVSIRTLGGRALKLGIETAGSQALDVPVTVDKVSFSILGGWVKLENLKVANPEGYQHENLLELGSGEMDVNIRSLLSDKIIVKSITLDDMSVVIEQKELVHSNLQEILDALPTPEEAEAQAEEPGKKVHVDKVTITDATVKAKLLPVPGRLDTVTVPLGDIEITDLGKDDKMTPVRLVAEILQAVAVGIAEKGRDLLPDDMIGAMGTVLEESGKMLKDAGKKVLEKGTDVGRDLIEGGKDLKEDVAEGLKGLLKGKDKDE